MKPTPMILRCDLEPPSCAEVRYYLRRAGVLLAASEVGTVERASIMRHARPWIVDALSGLDAVLRRLDRSSVPSVVIDQTTETHLVDELIIPSIGLAVRGRR
jgi:hypothetical protein